MRHFARSTLATSPPARFRRSNLEVIHNLCPVKLLKPLIELIDELKKKLPPSQSSQNVNKSLNIFAKGAQSNSGKKLASLGGISNAAKNANSSNGANQNGNGFWDLDDDEEIENVDYQTANLNKLTPEQVQKHKNKMDVVFQKNCKKPGDPGYIYDVQEDFHPHEDNAWDEDF